MKKKRLLYAAVFVILVGIEIVIGMFFHDRFVRPYLGDVIVVMAVYALVRIIIPEKYALMPLAVFVFAVMVEILQGIHIVDILGIQNSLLRTVIGTSFDFKDIICYAIGCIILGGYEFWIRKCKK